MSKTALIIDIRSDSVGGALVEPKFDKARRVICSQLLKSSRREINFQAQLNLERFFGDLVAAMKQVLAELFVVDAPKPATTTCFLSAPFYAAQTRTIKQTRPTPVTITRRLIADLTDADLRQFQSSIPPLYREILHDAHELIEHKIMQIRLNRYETRTPFGKNASEIAVSHYLSVSSEKVLNRFRELLRVHLPHGRFVFHSFPFVFYAIVRDSLETNLSVSQPSENVFLLDLGGEVTEISLVAHDILWETVSFPLGRNFLIRRLADDFQTVPEEALSALKIYQHGGYNKLASERMSEALARGRKEWLASFKEAFAALVETHLGTNKILAVGDPVVTPVFLDWIKQESYQDLLISGKEFRPSLLTSQSLKEICSEERQSFDDDPHLLLETIFYDKLMSLDQSA